MYDRLLGSFVPHIYKDVTEMDAIIDAEQIQLSSAQTEASQAFANTFVLTANYEGIEMFEMMLGIIADPATESLEFRRQRVLNRITLAPPFTFRFLKKRLDDIIGKDAWNAYVDFNNYTLYVESSALNQNWYQELEFTINLIKPCNIIFTNVPLTALLIAINEEISYRAVQWNYLLGQWRLGAFPFATISGSKVLEWYYKLGSWALGEKPFALTEGGVIIKMADKASITDKLLHDTAGFVLSDIKAVLINDSVKITSFTVSQAIGSVVTLEYEVTPAQVEEVTNIKLLDGDDNVLSNSNVWVPVPQTILGKHTIRIKEG